MKMSFSYPIKILNHFQQLLVLQNKPNFQCKMMEDKETKKMNKICFFLWMLSFEEFFLSLLRKSWIDAKNLSNYNVINFFHQIFKLANTGYVSLWIVNWFWPNFQVAKLADSGVKDEAETTSTLAESNNDYDENVAVTVHSSSGNIQISAKNITSKII